MLTAGIVVSAVTFVQFGEVDVTQKDALLLRLERVE